MAYQQHTLVISVSGGQEARHVFKSSTQCLTTLQSKGWPCCVLIWSLSEDDATSKLILLFWQNSLACGYSTEVLTEYWLEATFSF